MRRFKQFLTEASIVRSNKKYITQKTELPFNPNPENEGAQALIGAIISNPKINGDEKDIFIVISDDEYSKHKSGFHVPLGGDTHTVYMKESGGKYALRITSSSVSKIENAFFGGSSGKSGEVGKLSGSEGELFWEYVSYLAVTGKDKLESSYENTPDEIKSIPVEKLNNVLRVDEKIINGIYDNTLELIDKLGKGNPDFVYSRWEEKSIETYYKSMETHSDKVKLGQKQNVADAVWVWDENFIGKGGYKFVPDNTSEFGLIDVYKNGELKSHLLQVSLKKGKDVAQGGGTSDVWKGMLIHGLHGDRVYDPKMKSILVNLAKGIRVQPEGTLDSFFENTLDEGILDFIKSGLSKLRNVFDSIFGYVDKLVSGIKKDWLRGQKTALRYAKKIGLDKSMLTEAKRDDKPLIDSVVPSELLKLFNNNYKDIVRLVSNKKFGLVLDSTNPLQVPDKSWLDDVRKLDDISQQEHIRQILLNATAMQVIGNHAARAKMLDTDTLVEEMTGIVWDIKMGNTLLPMVQLYGDSNKWEILDRDLTSGNIEDIQKYISELEDVTSSGEFYPIIAQLYGAKTKNMWNVCHLYTIKSMTVDEDPRPLYFKTILRSDGFSLKMPTENKYYTWDGNETFTVYSGTH